MVNSEQAIQVLARLFLALLLSGILGFERDIHGRSAGLRTTILICIGAATYMLLAEYLALQSTFDSSRIGAQVISGIGFLGAGAIIKNQHSVRGLTTAATIWISAAIGLSCGAGYFFIATLVTAMALFCLIVLEFFEHKYTHDFFRSIRIETESATSIKELTSIFDIKELTILSYKSKLDFESARQVVTLKVKIHNKDEKHDLLSDIHSSLESSSYKIYKLEIE